MDLVRFAPRSFLAAVAATAPLGAASVPPGSAATTPTTFDVSGDGLHVTYTTAGPDGQPVLVFVSPTQTLRFAGSEIRTVAAPEVGTLVSVMVRRTIDTGSTSFTLVLPRVGLSAEDPEAPVTVLGITTAHRFSVLRRLNRGQLDGYSEVRLTGTARESPERGTNADGPRR
jgi:hypothetical protein